MPSLVDRFCPNVHDGAISAAAFDPVSGTVATADVTGLVAVQRRGESSPGLVFRPAGPVDGALALITGGAMLAVGDSEGSIGVFRTDDGAPVFQEIREGEQGRVRAMKGVALSPEGTRCAAIAADGLLRLWDLVRCEKEIAWRGFGGSSVAFDARGERILCMDEEGQPRLVDLVSREGIPLDHLQVPADRACFTQDGTHVVSVGPGGVSLLRVLDGVMVASFATRGGSGLKNLVLSPEGDRAAVITQRSVHAFTLPDLAPADSFQHGAPDTRGAAWWPRTGRVRVGGGDGLFHAGGRASPGPVTRVAGFGDFRAVAHADRLAFWARGRRLWETQLEGGVKDVALDREGRIVAILSEEGPVQVLEGRSGQVVFDGGPATRGATAVEVGGPVVAVSLAAGGIRWWHLAKNQAFDLAWPRAMALSGSGLWLGVVTPRGAVKVLDPTTGADAIAPPDPMGESPVRLLAFVNRRADLLVVDADGNLSCYDLAEGIREDQPARGHDVVALDDPIDRLWGITGNRQCALRLPGRASCGIAVVDMHSGVPAFLKDLPPATVVDVESGALLSPARGSAVLERTLEGREQRVLRSLAEDQWISFQESGILEASENVGEALG
ncbi:MAG: WD40 repeat domain-containing protein [Deltaproteobacteria bacterium]|nr:WD40 repeat domain-containing protein [Deltaproteobacteria bacterium]